jgi:hypothetical protein
MSVASHEPHQRQNTTVLLQSLDAAIDLATLRERVRDYLINHYLVLHITVVSVTLAMAGVSAASLITRSNTSSIDIVVLWLLWTGSLLATAVAYAGAMVGAFALPPAVPKVMDLVLPLLMGITEFLLFSILIRQVTSSARLATVVNTWLIMMAIFSVIALMSIIAAKRHLIDALKAAAEKQVEIYSPEAASVVSRYVDYLKRDQVGATTALLVAVIGAALRVFDIVGQLGDLLFPLILIIILVFALRGHGQTERMWRSRLSTPIDSRSDRS